MKKIKMKIYKEVVMNIIFCSYEKLKGSVYCHKATFMQQATLIWSQYDHQKSQQQSLLSFLSKTKSVPSGEMVSLNAPFTLDESYSDSTSSQRCRLWHPESDQENNISSDDRWPNLSNLDRFWIL